MQPYLASHGQALVIDATDGLLANDFDPDADPLEARADTITTMAGGTVELSADGSFSYRSPPSLPYGTDRFDYVVTDDHGHETIAEARVVVAPPDEGVRLEDLGPQGKALLGEGTDSQAGSGIAGVGDFDGDGFDDLVVTTSRLVGMDDVTELALVRGGPDRSSISLDQADIRFTGVVAGSPALAGAGDVDGDGFDDFLVGDRACGAHAGCVYLVLGGTDTTPLRSLSTDAVRFEGIAADDHAGSAVAGAGDTPSSWAPGWRWCSPTSIHGYGTSSGCAWPRTAAPRWC